jgi:hypothetical protein
MNKKITYNTACKISDHLLLTNQSFCFLPSGELITKEDCEKIIDEYNTIKK